MRRKGVYPYEYIDSFDKFNETQLPPKEAFYSKLNMTGISDRDYEFAQHVWNRITPEHDEIGVTLGDYHDRYLRTDVLLLADVFETFRETCMELYQLDPCHFYTSPGLTWQACLKKTGIELDLLSDMDMFIFMEKGIRGGLVQAVQRYAKANNKYMGDKYNPNEESTYLQYLDANNLYGWAMIQKLPVGNFHWCKDPDSFTTETISQLLSENGDKGYILQVDVKYPKELHDEHDDLPFMPERQKINKVEKLVPCLSDKKNYIIHIRALDQALKHGLNLEKVHRAVEFDQSAWLKPYIDFNTQLRTRAENEVEKDFFKLMNNSVFGKTMENIRKHKDIKLATNKQQYCNMLGNPILKALFILVKRLWELKCKKSRLY